MTLEEAETYVRARREEWLLLAVDVRTNARTYACPNCYRQRFTTAKGAILPAQCPKCGVALRTPAPVEVKP
jgi:hypothetical protein